MTQTCGDVLCGVQTLQYANCVTYLCFFHDITKLTSKCSDYICLLGIVYSESQLCSLVLSVMCEIPTFLSFLLLAQ